ncbi:MAG: hypothetical protein ACXVPQ_01510 [Bacteroidia bacterium]
MIIKPVPRSLFVGIFLARGAAAMTSNRNVISIAATFVATALSSAVLTAASAADMPLKAPPQPPALVSGGWTYQITPYIWLPSVSGSTTLLGRTTDVDVSFYDLAKHAQIPKDLFGTMAYMEARKDRFSVFADIAYMQVGVSASGLRVRQFAPELSAAIGATLGFKYHETIAQLAMAYELARWTGMSPGSWTALDVFGGGRFWWQRAEATLDVSTAVTLAGLTFNNTRAVAGSGDVNWVDPLVGLKLRHQFMPGQQIMLMADIGGFNVGSKRTWQAVGAYNFDIKQTQSVTWSGMVGYRALYVDYEQGSGLSAYEFNILQHGPILGITAQF